jgi:hypothetical protein
VFVLQWSVLTFDRKMHLSDYQDLKSSVSGLEFQGLELRAQGSGSIGGGGCTSESSQFRVQGSGVRAHGSLIRVQGSGFAVRVQVSQIPVSGFRVQGWKVEHP